MSVEESKHTRGRAQTKLDRGPVGADCQAHGPMPFLLVAALAGALSCTAADDQEQTASTQVEIFSWWVAPGEVEALDALVDLHAQRHPGVKVKNLAAEFADQARDELKNRMASGLPPDTFQANVGWGLLSWGEGAIEPLDEIAEREHWDAAFEPAVLDAVSKSGRFYGVPLNIHRINALFYNQQVLATHGIEPPTTLEELHQACLTLKQVGITPIALGNLNSWTLQELAFECVLPAMGGADFYSSYWQGLEQGDAQPMRDTLDYVIRLFADGCFNADSATIDWTDALDRVADGTAAFSEMGDWAKGYLESKGAVATEDFGVTPFPGTRGVFVFTSDSFPLPRGARNREGAIDLLITMASAEGQLVFNRAKGSIPARVDIDPSSLDVMQQSTYADWKTDEKVLAMSGLVRPDVMLDLPVKLKEAATTGDTDPVLSYLVNNYGTLE